MEFIPWTSFKRIVDRYAGNAGVRRLSCAEQFRVMAFAQLTWRESLRDIEVTFGANSRKLYANRPNVGVLDEQYYAASNDDCGVVQKSLAG
ncbi:DUF4372 domain-containing protein [Undibacterium sp. Jales W-56]|uniref:DUF4372 domain-containing protein n=1 Tax=Undibacterium sp. Jales W-56 TaxID=2897325 RepID=UPI00292EBA20|nr:DUF4372 domain-containing protein [Undibacterium sp. Jales W-56]